jgi:protein-L-isoaspartate(D-aspartate) O-methyltransferase
MGMMEKADQYQGARSRMVESQIVARGVGDERVLNAMRTIPRHVFLPAELQPDAYQDNPLPIGHGQTISQPYIVALMTSLLNLRGTEKILEVGTGSGYQAAVLGVLAAEVHSVEYIPELAAAAQEKLAVLHFDNVAVHVGDGSLGWPEAAPYDGILVAAGAPAFPVDLPQQLKDGGRLVIPVGARQRQMLQVWIKRADSLEKKEILPVVFVPLKGAQGWQDSDL